VGFADSGLRPVGGMPTPRFWDILDIVRSRGDNPPPEIAAVIGSRM